MERVRAEGRTGRTDPGASSAMAVPGLEAACAPPVAAVIWGGQDPGGCPGYRSDAHRSFSLLVKILNPDPILSLYPNVALYRGNILSSFD